MSAHRFDQLVDLALIRRLLESHHRLSGMASGLMDTEGHMLIAVGWQDICERFHRQNPVSRQCCTNSDADLQARARDEGGIVEHFCGNKMIDVALPIAIEGEPVATLFIGQFFYDDRPPDRKLFRAQALRLGFDPAPYLAALEKVPVFSREHVHDNLLFLRNMLNVLAETAREKLARLRRRESRNHLLNVALNTTSDKVFLIDEQLRFVYVNEAACRYVGNSREEMLTMTPPDIDPEITHEMCRGIWEKASYSVPVVFESRHRAPDGRVVPVEISVSTFEHDGAFFRLLVVSDITEMKRSEETIRRLHADMTATLQAIPDLLFEVDRNGTYLNVWAQRPDILAAQKELLLNRTIVEVLPSDAAEIAMVAIREADEKGYSFGKVIQIEFPDGAKWFEHSVSKKNGTNERNARFVVLSRDITERKQLQEAAGAREREFRSLAENTPDTIARYDGEGRRFYANSTFARLAGVAVGDLLGKKPSDYTGSPGALEYEARIKKVFQSGQKDEFEYIWPDRYGQAITSLIRIVPEVNEKGRIESVLCVGCDVTELKRTEALLHKREQEFRAMIENSPDPVVRYDRQGRRIYVNPAYEKLMGKPFELLLGKTPSETPAGDHAGVGRLTQQAVNRVLQWGVPSEVEASWDDKGSERCYQIRFVPEFDRDGAVATVLSTARDVTTLRTYQRQLHDLAYYDRLTGLPNRALFLDRLQQAVDEEALPGRRTTVLMLLDLDRFRAVNDSLGYGVGDDLLHQVGQRLVSVARGYGSVARLEGDEFAIILQDPPAGTTLDAMARKLLTVFAEPFDVRGRILNMTASLGMASCPQDSRQVAELVQFAETAMYHAKSRGRNQYQFCTSELRTCARERLSLEAALRNALKQQEFELYYQPKIVMDTGIIVGAEALLRWHHPEWGTQTPARFIGIAEDTGLIFELGQWVLHEACLTAYRWNRAGGSPLKVAVNLSARQFDRNDLLETIRAVLAATGCRPQWVELEITESLLLENRQDIRSVLEELCALGFTIAIDDFGTGYSALGYLAKFPINTLKIDRSFVHDVSINRRNRELIKAMASLGQALDMELVAEGVETLDQEIQLKSIGCQLAQGYLYGKPVSRGQFEEMFVVRTTAGPVAGPYCARPTQAV